MCTNDGGPAFPPPEQDSYARQFPGMSLRDWFAGMAIQRMHGTVEEAAKLAFDIADAMLKEREK